MTQGIDWQKIARYVLQSRILDELEVNQLTPQGKVKYQFSAMGHELPQVILGQLLDHPHDAASVYYRSRPFMLSAGQSLEECLLGGLALKGSTSEGREVGVMFNKTSTNGVTVFPTAGGVGTQYTPATGWAQAVHYYTRHLKDDAWDSAVAVAFGGDGSTATNGFWGALNMVTTLSLPMLFIIEDNQYGLSVPSTFQTAGGNISQNLACYQNLRIFTGDGTSPEETYTLLTQALDHARTGKGPCLVHLTVPRLLGHTFIDDQKYKSAEQRSQEIANDPIEKLRTYLIEHDIISPDDWDRFEKDAQQSIISAHRSAESASHPDPARVRFHIFYEGAHALQGGIQAAGIDVPIGSTEPVATGPRVNLIDAVRMTMESEMHRDGRILAFGEDVGLKGGVHGATVDMQLHFGDNRVFDTSLNEEAIIGRSVGLAFAGLFPIPEIQFRKYADPAHEQLSDIGTIRWRSANRFAAPMVVRMPLGYGKVTGDPWHSVSAEAIYAHLPGWKIAFPSNAADASGLLRTAIRGSDPVIFLEHRALLDTREARRPYPGDDYCLDFGTAHRVVEGTDLTIVTWGALVSRCEAAIGSFPGQVDLIDLRTIIPWDQDMVLRSLKKTGKLLIVHEDTITSGFGAEIAATMAALAFEFLDGPIQRLATPDIPIPYNIGLMNVVIPSVQRIRNSVQNLLEF